jgi:linoleate 10R-lipoxygenase
LTFLSIGDNEHGFSLRWTAVQAGGVVQALIAKSILEVKPDRAPVRIDFVTHSFWMCFVFLLYCFQGVISGFIAHIASALCPQGEKPYYPFLSKLAAAGRPLNELVATVVGLAVGSSVNYAQGRHVRPPHVMEN